MIVFIVIGILVVGGYIFLRTFISTKGFHPIKQAAAADPTPPKSVLDLRPQIINKLQQLVKQGSNGLYNLSIKEIEPDVVNSTLDAKNVVLLPDTAALQNLEKERQAPDDVFKITCGSLHIDGIAIVAFLAKNKIDVGTISFNNPVIEVVHQKKSYNKAQTNALTLYQRIAKQMKHIGIDKIIVHNGTLSSRDVKHTTVTKFNDITINLSSILIDSTTQFDKSRFFFAKDGEIITKNFVLPTKNHLYNLTIGSITISTANKNLKALNVAFKPHYSKLEFSKHIKVMTMWYNFSAPSIQLKRIDWWKLMNGESITINEAEINSGKLNSYFDLSLPQDPPKLHNFPHQMLMNLSIPVRIDKLNLINLDVSYEEYHPKSKQSGKLFFNKINGTINNVTNIKQQIKRNNYATLSASAIFMHQIPVTSTFRFNLAQYKTGVFSTDVTIKGFDGPILNSIAQPFGHFYIKRGTVQSATATVTGDNFGATGKVLFLYDSLHITPLKRDINERAGFKKKHLYSFIANTFVLKNENPSGKSQPRSADGSFKRDPHGTFFNLIWKTVLTGILKTIGAPQKLAGH